MKRRIQLLTSTITIVMLILSTMMISVKCAIPDEPHNADAMWVEPSLVNATGQSSGYRFNVTVWVNLTAECAGWQFYMLYDKSILNATRAGYTAGTKSDFFNNISALTLVPEFGVENSTHDYVLHGESWLFGPFRSRGYGSLSWVEFEIIAEPPDGGEIVSVLDISTYHHPPNSKTYTLDPFQDEIPMTVYNCIYRFKSSIVLPTYTLTITATSGGTTDPAPGTHDYVEGAIVSVTATPNINYQFDHWELDMVNIGSSNPVDVTMDTYHSLHAVFIYSPPEGTRIFVDPPEIIDPTMVPCSTFSVNITVDDVADLKTCIFNLSYNPDVIGWIGMLISKVQGQTPIPTLTVDDMAGFLWMRLVYPVPFTSENPVPLVRLDFHLEALGETPLDLHDTGLLDSQGQPMDHNATDGFLMALIRDVAVIDLQPQQEWTYQGWTVNITATVKNKGNVTETFDLTTYYDNSPIGTTTVTNLTPNEERDVTFEWDTTGVPQGNYTMKAEAATVPYEISTGDNTLIDGIVWVMTEIHDVAVINVTAPEFAYEGWIVNVTATVKNKGDLNETFTVQAFYDATSIGNATVTDLLPGNETDVIFVLNTENMTTCANYTISAEASTVPYEFNTTDNHLVDGEIRIRIMGDVNNDNFVDIKDIYAAADAYGSYPSTPQWDPTIDLDQNLIIDIKDIYIIATNYGTGCPQ